MANKRIHGVFSEEEHARLTYIKNKTGLNWEQFIIKAAESYDKFGEVKDVE